MKPQQPKTYGMQQKFMRIHSYLKKEEKSQPNLTPKPTREKNKNTQSY